MCVQPFSFRNTHIQLQYRTIPRPMRPELPAASWPCHPCVSWRACVLSRSGSHIISYDLFLPPKTSGSGHVSARGNGGRPSLEHETTSSLLTRFHHTRQRSQLLRTANLQSSNLDIRFPSLPRALSSMLGFPLPFILCGYLPLRRHMLRGGQKKKE